MTHGFCWDTVWFESLAGVILTRYKHARTYKKKKKKRLKAAVLAVKSHHMHWELSQQ